MSQFTQQIQLLQNDFMQRMQSLQSDYIYVEVQTNEDNSVTSNKLDNTNSENNANRLRLVQLPLPSTTYSVETSNIHYYTVFHKKNRFIFHLTLAILGRLL